MFKLVSGKLAMPSSSLAPPACGVEADDMKSGIGGNQKGRVKRRRDYAEGQPHSPAKTLELMVERPWRRRAIIPAALSHEPEVA